MVWKLSLRFRQSLAECKYVNFKGSSANGVTNYVRRSYRSRLEPFFVMYPCNLEPFPFCDDSLIIHNERRNFQGSPPNTYFGCCSHCGKAVSTECANLVSVKE